MKPVLILVTVAAFVTACAWVAMGRRPVVPSTPGVRRRFLIAVSLFAGLLSGCRSDGPSSGEPVSSAQAHHQVVDTLRQVWATLDRQRETDFQRLVDGLVREGRLSAKAGRVLAIAFRELAYHLWRSDKRNGTCYKMTTEGEWLADVRRSALKQVQALRTAKAEGTLDAETAARAQATLAKDLTALARADYQTEQDRLVRRQVLQNRQEDRLLAGDAETVAAGMVVVLEGGTPMDASEQARVQSMRERVDALLRTGPAGADWQDPALHPNLMSILETCGLLVGSADQVRCYKRLDVPGPERSGELQALQARLLDEKVQAGVLDQEIAAKVAAVDDSSRIAGEASEKDLAAWQRKVRRAVRLLYQAGEVPSDFVRSIEDLIDVPILCLDPVKSLPVDLRWYLQVFLPAEARQPILALMQDHDLVAAARNHRGEMRSFGEATASVRKAHVEGLREQFTTDTDPVLPEDAAAPVVWQIPESARTVRLRMRKALRCLVAAGWLDLGRSAPIERLLGLPLIGKLRP